MWPIEQAPGPVRDLCDHGPDSGKHLAGSLHAYWTRAVLPYWVRITGMLEEDVGHRASQSVATGLLGLFDDLHPRVLVRDQRLVFDFPGHRPAIYSDAVLTLVPSVFVWPGLVITHEVTGRFQVTYGARGIAKVWEGLWRTTQRGRSLSALLGHSRAEILQSLTIPQSTTQLARDLGQSAPAVSQHLRVLRESGLAVSWRIGRSVFYQQTPLAASLTEMNQFGHDLPPPKHAP